MQPTIEEIKDLIETSLKYYSLGMWCWLEDLWITDRYEAMEYWYNKAIEWILELLNTKYDIVEEWYTQQLQDDWSVLNKPIYVLQKSSQSREVQEESTSPTESEKKDFWKRFMKFMWQKYQFFMNEWNSEKIENFLSSNWYL